MFLHKKRRDKKMLYFCLIRINGVEEKKKKYELQ